MNAPLRKPVCDTDPARRGVIDLDAVAHAEYRKKAQEQRTYTVQHKPALDGTGRHWHLWISGPGHWCEGSNGKGGPGLGGSFPTEDAAEAVGKLWVRTGRTA